MSIELRHLRTLLALAETGSLSTAAERVHLTQSALSHQIKALENAFGVSLFQRKSTPLRLSAAGERLLRLARTVLPEVKAAERDLARMAQGQAGRLRIAVECHTCFDWLMPAMDAFREHWPEVELDLVSGFQRDPVPGLLTDAADLAITSELQDLPGAVFHPLFRYEILALLSKSHPLAERPYLRPEDLQDETLITYPVEEERLDVIRAFLRPAGIQPASRRTAELTVAILQLVASRRGVAALPAWAVEGYVEKGYVIAKPLGPQGLWNRLYAACTREQAELAYLRDFLDTVRTVSFAQLRGIRPLGEAA
ncbi:MAG: LysR family transcriptional regulator [Pseudomonadota bacterium]|uniref:LysR family transcriptional regulator n=1 Tax=Thermithiobacillus tepidarius TaxID=929 RepID=UPI001B7FAB86|nr:LysR family transcriptional regulator [Thermithiobacillus tepidarius]